MRSLFFSKGAALVVLGISMLLNITPFDRGVIVGDFQPQEYAGIQLHPLSSSRDILVEDVFFPSHGEMCHAWLYTTKKQAVEETGNDEEVAENINSNENDDPKRPVVVMAPGLGTQKDMGLDRYAQRFVQAGFVVFMFDYRNFGASTGTPRNFVSPRRHIQDYHAALDFLLQRSATTTTTMSLSEKVDTSRIALWGTSFSGGHVLEVAAARPQDIMGVVSQVPHLSGKVAAVKGIKKRGVVKTLRLALAALQDQARSVIGRPPVCVKIISSSPDELAIMDVTPEDYARYLEKQPPQPLGGWRNQVPARMLLEIRFYNPLDTLKKKKKKTASVQDAGDKTGSSQQLPPVLFIGSTLDDLCPPGLIEEASHLAPSSKLILRDGTHFQIYEPQHWMEVADEMVKFYDSCWN